jgi:hypothetical protein
MPDTDHPSPVFHIGVVVPDIERAKQQLGAVLGLTWGEPRHARIGDWELDAVFSIEGPPHFELLQGSPGSPWDAEGRARFDHVQRWSADLEADYQELAQTAFDVELDGPAVGLSSSYVRSVDGLRVELSLENSRAAYRRRWGIDQ